MKVSEFLKLRRLRQIETAFHIGINNASFSKYANGWNKLPKKYVKKAAEILQVSEKEIEDGIVSENNAKRAILFDDDRNNNPWPWHEVFK